MSRRMRLQSFRDDAWDRRYTGTVEPLNRFVDELRSTHDNSIPYVDPDCGGVNARVMLLLQDPGPKAAGPKGASRFLSYENDDPTAANVYELLHQVDLPWTCCVPWNAVPWYINRSGTVAELKKALPSLRAFRRLLPQLRGVVAMGVSAQDAWRRFAAAYPEDIAGLTVVETRHPSNRGLTRGGRRTKADGMTELRQQLNFVRSLVCNGCAPL